MTLLKWKDSADDLLQEKNEDKCYNAKNHKSLTITIWSSGQFSCCPTQHSICMILLTKRRKKNDLFLHSQRTQCLYYSSNSESTWRYAVWKMKLSIKSWNKLRHTIMVIITNSLILSSNILQVLPHLTSINSVNVQRKLTWATAKG